MCGLMNILLTYYRKYISVIYLGSTLGFLQIKDCLSVVCFEKIHLCYVALNTLSARRCTDLPKNKKPIRCHLLFNRTSYSLNMFRTLLCPSSGACDYDVDYHIGRFVLGLLYVGG